MQTINIYGVKHVNGLVSSAMITVPPTPDHLIFAQCCRGEIIAPASRDDLREPWARRPRVTGASWPGWAGWAVARRTQSQTWATSSLLTRPLHRAMVGKMLQNFYHSGSKKNIHLTSIVTQPLLSQSLLKVYLNVMKTEDIFRFKSISKQEKDIWLCVPISCVRFYKNYEIYPELILISWLGITLLPNVPNLSSSSPDDLCHISVSQGRADLVIVIMSHDNLSVELDVSQRWRFEWKVAIWVAAALLGDCCRVSSLYFLSFPLPIASWLPRWMQPKAFFKKMVNKATDITPSPSMI